MPKSISILGVTGSIGQSTADIIASAPERFDVCTITAYQNERGLQEAAQRLGAKHTVLGDVGLEEAVKPGTDLTIAAISGVAGLKPLMHAIKNSKIVAIANKEPLVAAGPLVMEAARKHNTQILPIDSEHNAIFQVFDPAQRDHIERIILTASGGPFRTWNAEQITGATPEQALAHPTWDMGAKISIDSASMVNKALEIIEAHILFGLPPEKIDVLIHPQSVVHSMVEYADGSVLAQMGASDMRTPISYALAWPERMRTPGETLDLEKLSKLDFEQPDTERFPAISIAYECLKAGQGACLTFNAANEVAVDAFLKNEISFPDIIKSIEFALDRIPAIKLDSISAVQEADGVVRRDVQNYIAKETASFGARMKVN